MISTITLKFNPLPFFSQLASDNLFYYFVNNLKQDGKNEREPLSGSIFHSPL